MSHTPGPWKVVAYKRATPKVYATHYIKGAGGPRKIADIYAPGSKFGETEVLYANARLIAAAPELLAACEMVAYDMQSWTEGENIALDMVRAAIAKAKGEGE